MSASARPKPEQKLSIREVQESFRELDSAIQRELKRLDSRGELPVWRKKINKSAVLRSFGISLEVYAYTKVGEQHFSRFDTILADRGLRTRLEALPDAIRAFVTENAQYGTLQFTGNKINRQWVLRSLGYHSPSLVRNPEANAAIEECDRIYAHLAPVSSAYPELADRLSARIAAGNLPIHKDRLNIEGLARELEVIPSAFDLVPDCRTLLDRANHAIRFEDPIRPFSEIHQRNYNFQELLDYFGRPRTTVWAQSFLAVAEGLAAGTAKQIYRGLVHVLSAIGSSGNFDDILSALVDGRDPSRTRAKECLRWYRGTLDRGAGTIDTVAARITNARRALTHMGLLQEAIDVLVPARRGLGHHLPKASLAEASGVKIDSVSSHVTEFARSHQIEFDRREVKSFLSNLAVAGSLADLEASQIPKAIEELNRQRLQQIYDIAVSVFTSGAAEFQMGQEMLQAGASQSGQITELLKAHERGDIEWREVHSFFAKRGTRGEEAYLYYIERHLGGKVPRSIKGLATSEKVRQSRLNQAFGGPDALHNKLHLSADAIGAACLMYLINAGANSSVGRSLKLGCVQPSTIGGHKEVVGWKARGGGKPIYNDLRALDSDGRPTAIEALEFVEKCQPCLARHSPENADSLFLVDMVGNVKVLPEHTLLAMLRRFVAADDSLKSFVIRVDMLRSSVLLDAALSGDGNLRVAGAVANHSNSNTTSHYVEKFPIRILYEAKLRKFQKLFQATIVVGIEGAAQRLGISQEEASALVGQAVSTGLGRMCLKPFAGIQPGTVAGEACNRLNACHSCEAIYLIVDAGLIADLIIWHGSLKDRSEALAATRPERFNDEWSDDLAWCESAIEALQRGPARKVFVEAQALANTRMATPGFAAPTPW